MAECGGIVVVEAPNDILTAFNTDRDEGLARLVGFCGADESINDECDVFFDELTIKGDSGCFDCENDYWLTTAKGLVSTADNLGIYLCFGDEYGAKYYLAQTPQGERFAFYAGGEEDDFEIEGGDVASAEDLLKWRALIPQTIQQAFPQLITYAG